MAQTASEIKELKEKLESDKQELDEAQTQLTEKQALLYSTIQETQAKADDVNSQLESPFAGVTVVLICWFCFAAAA